ncbi:MAG TPA: hypothetical protein VF076_05955, partial [Acidimicrobiales bacterium]
MSLHGELSAAYRRQLPKKKFAQPGQRKYPIHDRSHAANAKARATQQYRKGRLSRSQRDAIHARA